MLRLEHTLYPDLDLPRGVCRDCEFACAPETMAATEREQAEVEEREDLRYAEAFRTNEMYRRGTNPRLPGDVDEPRVITYMQGISGHTIVNDTKLSNCQGTLFVIF